MYSYTPSVEYNGSAALVIVATFTAAIFLFYLAQKGFRRSGLRCIDLLRVPVSRILVGSGIICLAFGLSHAFRWPGIVIAFTRDESLMLSWQAFILWPAILVNWLTVVGLAIMLWPWLSRLSTVCCPNIQGEWRVFGLVSMILFLISFAINIAGSIATLWLAAQL